MLDDDKKETATPTPTPAPEERVIPSRDFPREDTRERTEKGEQDKNYNRKDIQEG